MLAIQSGDGQLGASAENARGTAGGRTGWVCDWEQPHRRQSAGDRLQLVKIGNGSHQLFVDGFRDGFGLGMYLQFLVDVFDVGPDRVDADR